MKCFVVISSLALLAACSSNDGGGTSGGSTATGSGGEDAGSGGEDAGSGGGDCIAGSNGAPPSEGLYGCGTPSSCREAVLHSEIQWGHQSLIDVEECMGELVAGEQVGVLRWRSDDFARVAVLRGDGTALVQELSFTFDRAPAPEGCWTVRRAEQCVVGPVRCDDEVCETPRWAPPYVTGAAGLTDCVQADPEPTCEDVAALVP